MAGGCGWEVLVGEVESKGCEGVGESEGEGAGEGAGRWHLGG